jgi:transposase-like protein
MAALNRRGGNISAAAREIGCSRRALQTWMREWGVITRLPLPARSAP